MDGELLQFGVNGMANGLALMSDAETWSTWDHITGECFQGEHAGKQLDVWPMFMTTVEAALLDSPDLIISLSNVGSLKSRVMKLVQRRKINEGESSLRLLPFRRTFAGETDARLEKMAQGLGVIAKGQGKFYPMAALAKGEALEDVWLDRPLRVERGAVDGVLKATWLDTGELPMQLLSRWYGFAFTYPGCEIYQRR